MGILDIGKPIPRIPLPATERSMKLIQPVLGQAMATK